MGAATSQPGERLERVVRRADAAMYEAKRSPYSLARDDSVVNRLAGE
jgi:PleD family two-component response regulator